MYHIVKSDLIAGIKDKPHAYDKLAVVMIAVNDRIKDSTENKACDKVSRLLKVILSGELSVSEKKDILESEYQMKMESKTEGELKQMCNLAEGIEERGIQKGIQLGIAQGITQGIAVLIETYKEMNLDRETTAKQVRRKYKLTQEKTDEVMDRYWKETE